MKKFSWFVMYQSVPSLTIPLGDPRDSHIPVAAEVRFLLLCLAWRRVLNQKKCLTILKKSMVFALSLKQMRAAAVFTCLYVLEVSGLN